MIKRLIPALLAGLMLLTFAACGGTGNGNVGTTTSVSSGTQSSSGTGTENSSGSASAGQTTDKKVTIRTTIGPGELFQEQIDMYKAIRSNVDVELISADNTKLMSMIAAGTAPDVIRIMAVQDLPAYVTRGIASDRVQEFLDAGIGEFITDESDFLPVEDNYRWDSETNRQGSGMLYGFVKDFSNDQGLIINKSMFTEAGIDIPSTEVPLTYDQLGEICKKLSVVESGSAKRYGMTFWDSDLMSIWRILVYNSQAGESPWQDDYKVADFSNAATREYIDWALDLIRDGASVCSVVMQPPNGDYLGAFVDGSCAIANTGYWYTGTLRSNEKTKDNLDNFLSLPTPQIAGTEYVSYTTAATGAVMLRATNNPEETYLFMDYFFGGPPATDRAKSGWGLPMFKSLLELLPNETEFDKNSRDVAIAESEAMTRTLDVNPYIAPATMTNLLAKYLVPTYTGNSTVDEAIENINNELQPLIAEGMEVTGKK